MRSSIPRRTRSALWVGAVIARDNPRIPASLIKEAVSVVFPDPAGPERMADEMSGRSRRAIRSCSGEDDGVGSPKTPGVSRAIKPSLRAGARGSPEKGRSRLSGGFRSQGIFREPAGEKGFGPRFEVLSVFSRLLPEFLHIYAL